MGTVFDIEVHSTNSHLVAKFIYFLIGLKIQLFILSDQKSKSISAEYIIMQNNDLKTLGQKY